MKQKLTLWILLILFWANAFTVGSIAWGWEKPKAIPISKDHLFAPSFPQQSKDAALCVIQNDDGTPVYAGVSFDSGMGVAAYIDPTKCSVQRPYPFRITNVYFYLYHDYTDTPHWTWPVKIQVKIRNPILADKCLGPDTLTTLYSQSLTVPIDSSYNNLGGNPMNLTLSPPLCVYQPFFLEIDYQTHLAVGDTLPGLLMDEIVTSGDTCSNWGWDNSTGFIKWDNYWIPPIPGDLMIRVGGYTSAPECDTGWYWKADRINAPSGMPDFDQNQDSWVSYCGPVAAANCLWWYDAVPVGWTPPQLIDTLARYFHTNAVGTYVDSMLVGLTDYFHDYGFPYQADTFWLPTFSEISDSLKASQDILFLLYLCWTSDSIDWYVQGGHIVTMAGVYSESLKVAFSDPDKNNAENGGYGRVRPPHLSHPSDDTLHNKPIYVSQDIYQSMINPVPIPLGGFNWEINSYLTSSSKFNGMIIPQRFEVYHKPAPKDSTVYWHTYVGGGIRVCPKPSAVEDEEEPNIPKGFQLNQNYPNPFNPSTTIKFKVQSSKFKVPLHTTLKIYNILGQLVKTLVSEPKSAGEYEVVWDGKDEKGNSLASGIYFYRLAIGERTETKRMLLLK